MMTPTSLVRLGLLTALLFALPGRALAATAAAALFDRQNLVAWCIVPFDAKNRGPAARAEMVKGLGLTKIAYDWRAQHVPQFEEEILAYRKHGLEFFAFWGAHPEASRLFEKHRLHPQFWQTAPSPTGATPEEQIKKAAAQLLPHVERARAFGSAFGLYNHGGWGGEPENLVAVCAYLRRHHDARHVGIIYNLHHGHTHVDRFPQALAVMKPYLLCLNLNGMTRDGDQRGMKIQPLGSGELDLPLLRAIVESGYRGPIGIIGHTNDDVELRLRDNLDGLDWLVAQLNGQPAGPKPQPRVPLFPGPATPTAAKAAADPDPAGAAVAPGKEFVYKQSGGKSQKLEVYFPPNWSAAGPKVPGVILFHGGGWTGGDLTQFRHACRYLASRGLVAATANYRMLTKAEQTKLPAGETNKRVCVTDAKSAIRWFKQHAAELGVDSRRIITGGGSAGGHVSVLATLNPGLNDPADPQGIDLRVGAYLLFNPAFRASDSADPEVDVLRHLDAGMAPAVFFFGTEDRTWKPGSDTLLQQLKARSGSTAELWLGAGQAHGFFNRPPWQDVTLAEADRFLVRLGFLQGAGTLAPPASGEKLQRTP